MAFGVALDQKQVALTFADGQPAGATKRLVVGSGFSLERVVINDARTFDYAWTGDTHYLAFHNIRLRDGEAALAERAPVRRLDLRGRMTFAPKGTPVSGWSSLAQGANSYTAIFFDTDLIYRELGRSPRTQAPPPMLYFTESRLASTLHKLDALLADADRPDELLAETLALLSVLELGQLTEGDRDRASGTLTAKQLTIVDDYVSAHLGSAVTLDALANLVGLSRFHFSRAFARSTGLSPVRFAHQRRIAAAQALLAVSEKSIEEIAAEVGFGGARQFAVAFKKSVGVSPRDYRRMRR